MGRTILLKTEINGEEVSYKGRFLGFIKDDEFNALVHSKEVLPRIESKATQPLIKVCEKLNDLTGHRLVMTVCRVNNEVQGGKKLYVSEPLGIIDTVYPWTKRVVIQCREDSKLLQLEEKD